jgi:DNA-directed RNA polymerase subunit M/transcription elongation factor TFIIS
MGGMISFTNNFEDRSTDAGFQFEFYCDGCRGGHMSAFKPNKLGMAGGMMRAASSFFGGLGSATEATDQMRDMLRGKERDAALKEAVELAKTHMKHCGRCGAWVCPEACWNEKVNMCEKCAPDLEEELQAAQNTAKMEQMWRKARMVDMISDIDVTQQGGKPKAAPVMCAACGEKVEGKFCGSCGTPAPAAKKNCPGCGEEQAGTAKFCGSCGTKLA